MNIQRLKSVFGYAWAGLCLLVVLAMFLGLGFWERSLASGTGIHVSARFSGGEVVRSIDHGSYRTLLHRPVFDGLVGERAEGFVQIDWVPVEKQLLPPTIVENLDIDGDASLEVSIRIDTASGKVRLTENAPWVLEAERLIVADSERILRLRLQNPHRK